MPIALLCTAATILSNAHWPDFMFCALSCNPELCPHALARLSLCSLHCYLKPCSRICLVIPTLETWTCGWRRVMPGRRELGPGPHWVLSVHPATSKAGRAMRLLLFCVVWFRLHGVVESQRSLRLLLADPRSTALKAASSSRKSGSKQCRDLNTIGYWIWVAHRYHSCSLYLKKPEYHVHVYIMVACLHATVTAT
ncbi:hypothetical protein B0H11DRAFT_2207742, partial [Mycena galericulata]